MDPFENTPSDDGECCDPCAADPCDGLSPRDTEMYLSIGTELADAELAVSAVLAELAQVVADELDAAQVEVDAIIWETTGAVDLTLTEQEECIAKVVMRLVSDLNKVYQGYADEMWGYGITIPYSVGRQQELLNANPVDIAIETVPAIKTWLEGLTGIVSPPPYVPSGYVAPEPAIPPTLPPTIPVPVPGEYPPHEYPPLPPPGIEYPPLTPPPPQPTWASPPTVSSPRPAPPTPPPTPHAGTCPPVNVTVIVPPISVEGMYSPPPPAERDTGDSPPPPPPAEPPPPPPFTTGSIGRDRLDRPPPPPTPAIPVTPIPPGQIPAGEFDVIRWMESFRAAPAQAGPANIDWNNLGTCGVIDKQIASAATGVINLPNYSAEKQAAKRLAERIAAAEMNGLEAAWAGAKKFIKEEVIPAGRTLIEKIGEITGASEIAQAAIDELGPNGLRNPALGLYYAARLGLAQTAESKTGMPLTYMYQADQYASQYINPQYLPGQAEINAGYLTNQLSFGTWQCWTQANGNLPEPARTVMLSQQTKPGVMETVQLFYRGLITADELRLRMRALGVLEEKYTQNWVELYKVLPTATDLMRFMVRDSADEDVVAKYKYDTGFTEKFSGKVEKWSKAQGIESDVFKYFWRAHWEIPSNTALYEMFRRLRPDRPEVVAFQTNNPALVPGSDQWLAAGGPQVVTRDDIRQAMLVNDVAPGWVDRLIEVSYNPITRTDAVRAFQIGSFDENRLRDAMLDVGYSPTDADTLVKFYRQNKAIRLSNLTGTWTIRKITKYYKAGSITRDEATRLMKPLVGNPSEIDAILDGADAELTADQRAREVKALRRGYMYGEYGTDDAARLLNAYGLDAAQVVRTMRAWQTDRDGRHKQPSTTMITAWMVQGLVSATEAKRRLVNLGYKPSDADKIVSLAVMKAEEKGTMSAEQAGGVFEEAINNARKARQASEGTLMNRLGVLQREVARIVKEVNTRRENAGQMPLPAMP